MLVEMERETARDRNADRTFFFASAHHLNGNAVSTAHICFNINNEDASSNTDARSVHFRALHPRSDAQPGAFGQIPVPVDSAAPHGGRGESFGACEPA